MAARQTIAIPPRGQSLDVSGPLDVFVEANRESGGKANYDVRTVATGCSHRVTTSSLKIIADLTLREATLRIDTLLVTGTPYYEESFRLPELAEWLELRAPKARRFCSVCTGAFYLGFAGLLDRRRVTTHWQHADRLASTFPTADVVPDAIYVRDENLYTSAGVTAGIDLALKLVEEDHGRELALRVARRLVVFLRRPGGQSQFSAHLAAESAEDKRIEATQKWIIEHVADDLTLKALAARATMSVRNFTRVFQSETRRTPAEFVELARVDAARRQLEETGLPLKQVAAHCGFSSADIMRRAFLRRVGIGPKDYRERFRR